MPSLARRAAARDQQGKNGSGAKQGIQFHLDLLAHDKADRRGRLGRERLVVFLLVDRVQAAQQQRLRIGRQRQSRRSARQKALAAFGSTR